MGNTSNTSGNPGARRRSQRVLMQVSIRIRGTDAQGQKFEEETETLAINAHGALILLTARVTSGCKVEVKHKRTEEEQECQVVFLGPVRGGRAEVGLEFSSPRPAFWRVAFPPEDWSPKSPEARTSPAARVVEK
jgi:PilZ domain-containing protein